MLAVGTALSRTLLGGGELDVAIIGAGPVGLALAIELSRLGLSTLVVDRRPPLAEDAHARPQLLVARAGDLGHLKLLGIDVTDPLLVSRLTSRCERDLASGRFNWGGVVALDLPARMTDLRTLASQGPYALVPIARLQQALLAQALEHGAIVRYGCEVTRLRRHARAVSLQCADGTTARAAMVVIATGAARSLIQRELGGEAPIERQLIAGVFDVGGEHCRWIRAEVPVPGFARPSRCTMLQTPADAEAGTALIVDPQTETAPTPEQLHHCFETAARVHDLAGAPFVVAPQVFATAASAMSRRFIGGDGRAPIVIAGDAAQTGHVFSGQTCFVNLALAMGLGERLRAVKTAIVERKLSTQAVMSTLARYNVQSAIGAALLARSSQRHYAAHPSGAWALAGVA